MDGDSEHQTLYSKLVEQIAELQTVSTKPPASSVDISGSFKFVPSKASTTYQQLLVTISEIERRGTAMPRQPVRRQVPIVQPQAQQHISPQPIMQPAKVQPVQQPMAEQVAPITIQASQQPGSAQQQVMMQQPRAPQAAKVSAEKELAELTKALPIRMPLFGAQKLQTGQSNLVLVNLSLLDQISELERLFEGVRSGVLMQSDLDVVRKEVVGLALHINEQKEQIKRKRMTLTQDEYPLWEMRDQRIRDLISALDQVRPAKPKGV